MQLQLTVLSGLISTCADNDHWLAWPWTRAPPVTVIPLYCVWMVAPWVPLHTQTIPIGRRSRSLWPPFFFPLWRESTVDVPCAHSCVRPVLVHLVQSALFPCNDHQRGMDCSVWITRSGEMLYWRIIAYPLHQLTPVRSSHSVCSSVLSA